MVIWTTTPWTLPANLGIALHPDFTYVVGKFIKDDLVETFVIVRELIGAFTEKTGYALAETIREGKGKEFEGLEAGHPFLDRTSKLILANFVTTETGTGAVHIAPGHGSDDYVAGQQNGLAVLSPVDNEGKFTEEVGLVELVGMHVFKSNTRIIEILAESGHLLGQETYKHSYPHCWRSKTPIIFRAVEQFFISLDTLRGQALTEIDKVEWLPAWGRNRIYGTVESRPDWCISRQRTWGVPLPVFFAENGEVIISSELALKVADLVEKEGTNVWFEKSDAELAALLGLPAGVKKCRDTLDVWIDSGCSHAAVLDAHPRAPLPGRSLSGSHRPAPRLVPKLAHAQHRLSRPRALQDGDDPRLRGRQGQEEACEIRRRQGRKTDRRRVFLQPIRCRHRPPVGVLAWTGRTKSPSVKTSSNKSPSPTAACATRCGFC